MSAPWKVGDKIKIKNHCKCGCMPFQEVGNIAIIKELSTSGSYIKVVLYENGRTNGTQGFANPCSIFELVESAKPLTKEDCM